MEEYEKISKIEKRRKDKSQIATTDKVLDRKTTEILKSLQERGKLTDLSGAFSSGKEANVYTAKCSNSLISKFIQQDTSHIDKIVPVVLKIYKTSTMMFKDRTRYIIDEQRFKNFCTSNSRKLIKLWSEKEVRNLKRLGKHGIPCPTPLYLKRSILIMSMIGDKSPAPKLKDLVLSSEKWLEVYNKCIKLIKDMYQKAHLIHADFSEYNLIYHNDEVYVIDVSQSMDINQENSNSFLVMDLCNCNEFFSKKIPQVKSEVELFEEITGLKIPKYLKVDGKLNKECFIPSRIIDVANKEDVSLFIDNYKDTGLSESFLANLGKLTFKTDENEGECSEDEEEYLSENEELDEQEYSEEQIEELDEEDYSYENEDLIIDENSSDLNSEDSLDSIIDIEVNEISEIVEEDVEYFETEDKGQVADFKLKSYSDLTDFKIDIYVRRLRLKYPDMTKEQEKEINKQRKAIVKQMNRERRIRRVQRKEDYKTKKMKKKNNLK